MTNSKIYQYLFVRKDPVLMANPYRKVIGSAVMAVGTVHVVIGTLSVTGVVS